MVLPRKIQGLHSLYHKLLFFTYSSRISLKVEDRIKYKFPQLRVMATYNLFMVDSEIPFVENSSSASFSKLSVKITQAASMVSPLEYDQFIARNEYLAASL